MEKLQVKKVVALSRGYTKSITKICDTYLEIQENYKKIISSSDFKLSKDRILYMLQHGINYTYFMLSSSMTINALILSDVITKSKSGIRDKVALHQEQPMLFYEKLTRLNTLPCIAYDIRFKRDEFLLFDLFSEFDVIPPNIKKENVAEMVKFTRCLDKLMIHLILEYKGITNIKSKSKSSLFNCIGLFSSEFFYFDKKMMIKKLEVMYDVLENNNKTSDVCAFYRILRKHDFVIKEMVTIQGKKDFLEEYNEKWGFVINDVPKSIIPYYYIRTETNNKTKPVGNGIRRVGTPPASEKGSKRYIDYEREIMNNLFIEYDEYIIDTIKMLCYGLSVRLAYALMDMLVDYYTSEFIGSLIKEEDERKGDYYSTLFNLPFSETDVFSVESTKRMYAIFKTYAYSYNRIFKKIFSSTDSNVEPGENDNNDNTPEKSSKLFEMKNELLLRFAQYKSNIIRLENDNNESIYNNNGKFNMLLSTYLRNICRMMISFMDRYDNITDKNFDSFLMELFTLFKLEITIQEYFQNRKIVLEMFGVDIVKTVANNGNIESNVITEKSPLSIKDHTDFQQKMYLTRNLDDKKIKKGKITNKVESDAINIIKKARIYITIIEHFPEMDQKLRGEKEDTGLKRMVNYVLDIMNDLDKVNNYDKFKKDANYAKMSIEKRKIEEIDLLAIMQIMREQKKRSIENMKSRNSNKRGINYNIEVEQGNKNQKEILENKKEKVENDKAKAEWIFFYVQAPKRNETSSNDFVCLLFKKKNPKENAHGKKHDVYVFSSYDYGALIKSPSESIMINNRLYKKESLFINPHDMENNLHVRPLLVDVLFGTQELPNSDMLFYKTGITWEYPMDEFMYCLERACDSRNYNINYLPITYLDDKPLSEYFKLKDDNTKRLICELLSMLFVTFYHESEILDEKKEMPEFHENFFLKTADGNIHPVSTFLHMNKFKAGAYQNIDKLVQFKNQFEKIIFPGPTIIKKGSTSVEVKLPEVDLYSTSLFEYYVNRIGNLEDFIVFLSETKADGNQRLND